MSIANIGSKWVGGDLVVFSKITGDTILTVKADGSVEIEGGATGEFTTADEPAQTVTVTNGVITAIEAD